MNRSYVAATLALAAFVLPVFWYAFNATTLAWPAAAGPVRSIPVIDQTVVVVTAFVMKPLYMLMSLVLAWYLRRARASDLVVLKWGLLAFFTGEAFCAINYLFFHDQAYLMEYFHSYGMLLAFGLTAYALVKGLDDRIIHYGDPARRCSIIALCGSCCKTQQVSCKGRALFQLTALVLAVLALVPLTADPGEVSYVTRIFNTPYNYTWLRSEQLFELRYTPILALAMFILALVIVRRPRVQVVPPAAQISLCAGIGALGFGAMRLVLGTLYAKNLAWSSSWEEIIEFLSMIFIAYVLYQFRRRFALRNDAVPA